MDEDIVHVADHPIEANRGLRLCPLEDSAGGADAEWKPIKTEAAQGCDESGEESGLWAMLELLEAATVVERLGALSLSEFGEAVVD